MLLTLIFLAAAANASIFPPDRPKYSDAPEPFHGHIEYDGIAYAKIYPIMPGFDIFTYPLEEKPPSEEELKKIQFNLRARFRHISSDPEHSLYDDGQGFCQMELGTKRGSYCYVTGRPEPIISGNSTEIEHGLTTFTYPEHGCAWTNFHRRPPTSWFNDPGYGVYGIRYTAVRGNYSKSYQGGEFIQGGWGCHHEGLCFPQIVFYRRGYRLVISTWKIPVARREFCDFPGGSETKETVTRYELCVDRTYDQFDDGGAKYRYVCSVPCWNDGNIDVPQPHHPGKANEFQRYPHWNEEDANWSWTEGVDTCK